MNLSHPVILLLVLAFSPFTAVAADEPPIEWIDPDTGHRIVRLSREPGSSSFYFHQNAYTPDGKKIVITTPDGVATVNLETRVVEPVLTGGRVNTIIVGRKSGDLYYSKREENELWVHAVNLDTRVTRKVARVPRGTVSSVNADETLLLGTYSEEPEFAGWQRGGTAATAPGAATTGAPSAPPAGGAAAARPSTQGGGYQANWPDGTPMTFADAKELRLHEQLWRVRAGPPRTLFTLSTTTGEVKIVFQQREWLNHLQFSPTDPHQIMFCHEGAWHEVDRIWLIRTDGTGLTKVHPRTMNMEIYGHEFFSADGRTIWYDLHRPRGVDLWVAGYEIATGRRTWWHLPDLNWNVHYNISTDGQLFCGDGSDEEMVTHAKDAKWIYLLRPQRIPDVAGIKNPESDSLINPGFFQPERLVSLAKHDYRLEPNATFTPDMKWIVFRSNMHGPTHVYAVEVARSKS